MFSLFSYHDVANTDANPFYCIASRCSRLGFLVSYSGIVSAQKITHSSPCIGNEYSYISISFPFHCFSLISISLFLLAFSFCIAVGAVKNALSRDGLDPGIMDKDPDRSLKSQQGGGDDEEEDEADTGPALKDDPVYAKYFKMLKVGLPIGAVKNACTRDNVDPSIMDCDPERSLKSQQGKSSSAASAKKKENKKPKVRRKKLYWTPIDEKKIEKDSLWSIVRGSINMSQLKYDASEFENLFTDKLEKKKVKSPTAAGGAGATGGGGPKKSVQVIDGKRGMNGGIILSRIKMEYSEIAKLVDMMENRKKFDTTQLKALKEFLPTDEEAQALKGYLAKASTSEEAKAKAMADLCACEQYMVAMLEVPNAAAKFDCMLFKTLFQSRLDEIMVRPFELHIFFAIDIRF